MTREILPSARFRPSPDDQVPYPGFPFQPDASGAARDAGGVAWHAAGPAIALPDARARVRRRRELIPLAYQYPDSTFLGVDLSARAIEAGRDTIARLGLRNIELRALDLADMTRASEPFDYIVAHGVDPWVPASVRACWSSVPRQSRAPGCRVRQLQLPSRLVPARPHARDDAVSRTRHRGAGACVSGRAGCCSRRWRRSAATRRFMDLSCAASMSGFARWTDPCSTMTISMPAPPLSFSTRCSRTPLPRQYLVDATAPVMTEELVEMHGELEGARGSCSGRFRPRTGRRASSISTSSRDACFGKRCCASSATSRRGVGVIYEDTQHSDAVDAEIVGRHDASSAAGADDPPAVPAAIRSPKRLLEQRDRAAPGRSAAALPRRRCAACPRR